MPTNRFVALSEFRYRLACFLRFSAEAARASGVLPTQYLLLLHLRGAPQRNRATVGELARRLQASPHGTAALVGRCVRAGLVVKRRRRSDARVVEVSLTRRGARLVASVAARHRGELRSLRQVLRLVDAR